jgi:hypothetical protein
MAESASADFHEPRQGFSPPKQTSQQDLQASELKPVRSGNFYFNSRTNETKSVENIRYPFVKSASIIRASVLRSIR